MSRPVVTIDGNEAASYVAHAVSEVISIYPITPSSGMGEFADAYSAEGRPNIWGTVPVVQEMQSEAGASATLHGAAQCGALTTTFTASQGLLLMIPTMFKMAGELSPTVFHVSARTIATHALSIFGDHSDVMAVRSTGFALLASGSVQEVMDLGLIAHAATLDSRVPFLHFFDGFRTTHEVNKIEMLTTEDIRHMINEEAALAHRERRLTPDRPIVRGTAQNPDVFFQAREACNPFYNACAGVVQQTMDKFAKLTGRHYHLFDYYGAPDAERVLVIMGSGGAVAQEAVEYLAKQGEKVGLVRVRLYRPFSGPDFVAALPSTTKMLIALDRTKEPGAIGEPLYEDMLTAVAEGLASDSAPFKAMPRVIGGRYGLSSKDFTPAMVKGCFDESAKPEPRNHFTVGIHDDVTHMSVDFDPTWSTEGDDVVRALFYGLGADGTVGANKNTIKIIGEDTDNYAQGYFVYDSKKAGAVTVSHVRFGPRPLESSYLINKANFVGCHQFVFIEKIDMLKSAVPGATFLLNSPYGPEEVWDKLPKEVQQAIIDKNLKLCVIDAYSVARETGMGARINTIMQTCFFAISGVLPRDEAIAAIKNAIKKTYASKGANVVEQNFRAVDQTIANLHEVKIPGRVTSTFERPPTVPPAAPEFVQNLVARIVRGEGDELPVSAMPADGTFPTATTRWEKRNIALEIPVWDPEVCIQCGKCSMVCPHAAIRMNIYEPARREKAPATFKSAEARGKEFTGLMCTVQVAPEDCTGCGGCVHTCPAKNKKQPRLKAINMQPQIPLREAERANYEFFLSLPEYDRAKLKLDTVKGSQLLTPLFEYSGACAGCGETPYVQLLTQLFGDRAVIGNATGCSSIYGGNLPTTPYAVNREGRGPAWNNSLFEDTAEFALGFRLTLDKHNEYARELVRKMKDTVGGDLAEALLRADQSDEAGIRDQRERVAHLKEKIRNVGTPESAQLLTVADALVRKSVWAVGGDGWAYDIGYGGLDHVLASGRNVNILVLDTEVYSNTGGQMSKSTPRAAVAKFAAAGKPLPKKDLGLLAMSYGGVYVAKVALGANDLQVVRAFLEADAYDGPSMIIAYAHCIAHGINMRTGMDQQKAAVQSGHWPLYRFNPLRVQEGQNPLKLDSKAPKIPFEEYAYKENRYKMLAKSKPEEAARLLKLSQQDVLNRWQLIEQMSQLSYGGGDGNAKGEQDTATDE